MKFLYEKQTRRFYLFLVVICLLQICVLGICGIFQAQDIRRILIKRELAAASYLLEQEVSPALVASAWNHVEVTEDGKQLLETIGHTEHTQSYLLLLVEQTSVWQIAALLSAGLVFAIMVLGGTGFFLRRREQMYESIETVIAEYDQNRFENHLPAGETGAIFQLFGSIEQLAMSLQAKSEMEHKAKMFLRDMISNISHQLKTPLAALNMYMEIIKDEPENEETVKIFSQKSMKSLERMEQLIQSLLKMARLDTGNIVFEKRECFAAEVAGQAVDDLLDAMLSPPPEQEGDLPIPERTAPEPEQDMDEFLAAVLGASPTREEGQTENPTEGRIEKSRQSEPTSKPKEQTAPGTSDPQERSRPSVRKELNDIKAEQRQKAEDKARGNTKRQKPAQHKAPPKKKSKKQKER